MFSDSNDPFSSYYRNKYDSPSEWRNLTAVAKANNIRALWKSTKRPEPVTKVIDIGCGEGAVASRLATLGFYCSLLGVDIDSSGVAIARARNLPNAEFMQFDGSTIPAEDNQFELAVLSHVIEHAESPRILLNEAARVAAYVYVEVPLELNSRMPKDFTWEPVGHVNFFNPVLIRQLLQSSGLSIIRQTITCPPLEAFAYGRSALVATPVWIIKRSLLLLSPRLASKVSTYHGALLARGHGADSSR